jgi:uncharacterized protein YjbI with pentapeptide repeats
MVGAEGVEGSHVYGSVLLLQPSKPYSVLLLLLFIISSIFNKASAFSLADLHRLQTTGNCIDCNLSGAVLIHYRLRGPDLSGSNLAGANLTDTYLAGANLSGTNLSGAILISVSLTGANLIGARLSGVNLLYTDLARAIWVDGLRCERPSSGWCWRSH